MSNLLIKNSPNADYFDPKLKSIPINLEEDRYLFIIADRKKASLFLFKKGDLEDNLAFMHPGVKKMVKTDSGELYGRNNKLSRHIDKQIHEHLQLIMQQVKSLIKGKQIDGVFIGGHKPLHHNIKDELPKILQGKIKGTFITELNISTEELTKHCIQVLNEYSSNINQTVAS